MRNKLILADLVRAHLMLAKLAIVFTVMLTIVLNAEPAWTWDLSLSAYRLDDKVQNDRGEEASDPIQPALSVGHVFDLGLGWYESIQFSPRIGYVRDLSPSGDSYGQQRIEHLYVLYDFTTKIADSTSLRYGLGTFQKRVSGDGGPVTIPNGSGTTTAYRPADTKTSSTASTNLGLDYSWSGIGGSFAAYRLAAELHAYQLLDSKRRWIAYQLFFGVEF